MHYSLITFILSNSRSYHKGQTPNLKKKTIEIPIYWEANYFQLALGLLDSTMVASIFLPNERENNPDCYNDNIQLLHFLVGGNPKTLFLTASTCTRRVIVGGWTFTYQSSHGSTRGWTARPVTSQDRD